MNHKIIRRLRHPALVINRLHKISVVTIGQNTAVSKPWRNHLGNRSTILYDTKADDVRTGTGIPMEIDLVCATLDTR